MCRRQYIARQACKDSPSVVENYVKEELGRRVSGGEYDEKVVREMVEKVRIGMDKDLEIFIK